MAAVEEIRYENHGSKPSSDSSDRRMTSQNDVEDRLIVEHVKALKPSLSDMVKVGFFSQDRASQTNSTEVVEVKELSEVVRLLLKDTSNLKRDLMFTRQWMQTDFESKIRQKSVDLYSQVNDKVRELERIHEDRMDIVRRAFRQQLCDGLANVNQSYNQSMAKKLKSVKKNQDSAASKWEDKYKQLQLDMYANEGTIKLLREQIINLQENPANSDQMTLLQAEIDEMKSEARKLHKQIERLDEALEIKDQEITAKNEEMDSMNEQFSGSKEVIQKLQGEIDAITDSLTKERAMFNNQLESQRLQMEKEMESKSRGAADQVLAMARKEAEQLLEDERFRYQQLLDQKILLEQLLSTEKAKVEELKSKAKKTKPIEPPKPPKDEKIQRSQLDLMAEIERLKREIDRNNRSWEKKFAILQQSMRALKDESYLRTSLQRQAAQLHQVTVTYSMDNPHIQSQHNAGEPPPSSRQSHGKKPLPNIPANQKPGLGPRDQLEYTMSAHSGRGTELFSLDENQVMSDNEDLPDGILPLPPPPIRGRLQDSAGSDKHVVIMPVLSAR